MFGTITKVAQRQAHVFADGHFIFENVDEPRIVLGACQRLGRFLLFVLAAVGIRLLAELQQRGHEGVQVLLLALLLFQPAFSLLFQFSRLLAEQVETEGAGAAGEAMKLVA